MDGRMDGYTMLAVAGNSSASMIVLQVNSEIILASIESNYKSIVQSACYVSLS
jgi:hypothetical protein